ncbi:hypothetical protein [Clostridium sp.]|uniref:hypothetical protein n=1 Tax=Clostridium sp. TaxID=1506 RepID=UPI00284BC9B2|nr:hypothetical protein [Clostridium sp.]MDR3594328.1 hypothetical protein [Clostridium sp.]
MHLLHSSIDTVVFPAFHELVTPEEFKEFGDLFEEIEDQKFGKDGFKRIFNIHIHPWDASDPIDPGLLVP